MLEADTCLALPELWWQLACAKQRVAVFEAVLCLAELLARSLLVLVTEVTAAVESASCLATLAPQ